LLTKATFTGTRFQTKRNNFVPNPPCVYTKPVSKPEPLVKPALFETSADPNLPRLHLDTRSQSIKYCPYTRNLVFRGRIDLKPPVKLARIPYLSSSPFTRSRSRSGFKSFNETGFVETQPKHLSPLTLERSHTWSITNSEIRPACENNAAPTQ